MKRLKVLVLYEYGRDFRPHGSAFLRLLRPFSHPTVAENFEIIFTRDFEDVKPDLVILDRLWMPWRINVDVARKLIEKIQNSGAKFYYSFDDNFGGMEVGKKGIKSVHKDCFDIFVDASDGLIVTTGELQKIYQEKKSNTLVLKNVLDERLLIRKPYGQFDSQDKLVIGYMGTSTHDEDFQIVLSALVKLKTEHKVDFRLEILGVLQNNNQRNWDLLQKIDHKLLSIQPGESEYPLFMMWFTSMVRWDIGISPLVDNSFNRCKSDIKFLDYSAAGIPGIYSDLSVYSSSIDNLHNGMLTKNTEEDWVTALKELSQNHELRKSMAQKADDYLYEKRVLQVCGKEWARSVKDLA